MQHNWLTSELQIDSNITDNLFTIGDEESDLPFYQRNEQVRSRHNHGSNQSKNKDKSSKKKSRHKQLKQNWVNDKWDKGKQSKKGKNNFKRRRQF